MPIRIKCSDNKYRPPNVAYLYQLKNGNWACALANGIPAGFSYAGIENDEMKLKFALEDAETPDEALAAVKANARHYLSGPKRGETVYDYEIVR